MLHYLASSTQLNTAFLTILFNVYIYIFTLLFFFLLLFSLNTSFLKSLSNFKYLTQTTFFTNSLVFLFLSLAGIPPFLGFVGKFLIVIFFFSKNSFLFLIAFFLFNCFTIYFYIQHLKFLIFKNRTYFNFNLVFNFNIFFLLNCFFFFFVFGLFCYQTFLILLSPICFI